MKRSQES
jgi:hypothetical protein